MIKTKYDQLQYVDWVWEPHYNGDPDGTRGKAEVYISKNRLRKSKLDIKLKFEKVGPTSAYAGLWFLRRKDIPTRTKFDNNGLECYVVPWSKFEKLEIVERDERALW